LDCEHVRIGGQRTVSLRRSGQNETRARGLPDAVKATGDEPNTDFRPMTQASEYRQGILQDAPAEAALYRLAELAAQFGAEHIASTARGLAERVSEGRFYAACVGQFKRGKSTLLNALIGHAVLPTAVVPVTSVPTIIRHGTRLA